MRRATVSVQDPDGFGGHALIRQLHGRRAEEAARRTAPLLRPVRQPDGDHPLHPQPARLQVRAAVQRATTPQEQKNREYNITVKP